MPIRMRSLLLLASLAAAGCTGPSAEERSVACRSTDWSSYGYNDGQLGVPAAERANRFADCADLGYPADVAAYEAGRGQGLAEYCTVENGYKVGYAGQRYRKVCPPALESHFLQGYEQGRKERPSGIYPSVGIGIGIGSGGGFGSVGIGF